MSEHNMRVVELVAFNVDQLKRLLESAKTTESRFVERAGGTHPTHKVAGGRTLRQMLRTGTCAPGVFDRLVRYLEHHRTPIAWNDPVFPAADLRLTTRAEVARQFVAAAKSEQEQGDTAGRRSQLWRAYVIIRGDNALMLEHSAELLELVALLWSIGWIKECEQITTEMIGAADGPDGAALAGRVWRHEQAIRCHETGRYWEAAKYLAGCDAYVSPDPEAERVNAHMLHRAGHIQVELGDLNRADALLRQSYEIKSRHAERHEAWSARSMRGFIAGLRGEPEAAAQLQECVANLDPDDHPTRVRDRVREQRTEAEYRLAKVLRIAGQFRDAQALIDPHLERKRKRKAKPDRLYLQLLAEAALLDVATGAIDSKFADQIADPLRSRLRVGRMALGHEAGDLALAVLLGGGRGGASGDLRKLHDNLSAAPTGVRYRSAVAYGLWLAEQHPRDAEVACAQFRQAEDACDALAQRVNRFCDQDYWKAVAAVGRGDLAAARACLEAARPAGADGARAICHRLLERLARTALCRGTRDGVAELCAGLAS